MSNKVLTLDAAGKQELRTAITKAFNPNSLDMLTSDYLGEPLAMMAQPAGFDYQAHQVIGWAEDRGWLGKLVRGVITERPDNPHVMRLERALGLHPVDEPRGAFEAQVGDNKAFLDVDSWLFQGHVMATRVCQVRSGTLKGTGFLVGPDAVMTAGHVMAQAAAGAGGAKSYEFVFGYARTANGTVISSGEMFRAASDWCIARAPTGDPETPGAGDLALAVVKLEKPVGRLAVDKAASGKPRGWIDVERSAYAWSRPGLSILQHPEGDPMKLAFSPTEVATWNDNHTRVRYSIPTKKGSSGAPVFDLETWRVVGVHHYGATGQYNQAVPMETIALHPDVVTYLDSVGEDD
jgi:hypothetical protein